AIITVKATTLQNKECRLLNVEIPCISLVELRLPGVLSFCQAFILFPKLFSSFRQVFIFFAKPLCQVFVRQVFFAKSAKSFTKLLPSLLCQVVFPDDK
ncbi:MAG: hypothetical protein WBB84_00725, partial [Candidatus Omnitrophota bacterium]